LSVWLQARQGCLCVLRGGSVHRGRINNLMTVPGTQHDCWRSGHPPGYQPPFCLDRNGERCKGAAFPPNHVQTEHLDFEGSSALSAGLVSVVQDCKVALTLGRTGSFHFLAPGKSLRTTTSGWEWRRLTCRKLKKKSSRKVVQL